MNTKLMATVLLAIAASGCSGGGDRDSSSMPPVSGPPPLSSVDAFTQAVQSLVASSSDAATSQEIDGIAAVDADAADPIAIY
jgi:hypothetical protein